MRRILFFIALFACQLVLAGVVTPEEAMQQAQAFLSRRVP